jgi:hypothetical protein
VYGHEAIMLHYPAGKENPPIIPIIIGAPIIIIDIIIVIHSYIVNRHCCKPDRVAAVIGCSKLFLATRLDKISRKWDTPSLLIMFGASLGI